MSDFYDNWSIEATCDTTTLESSHPVKHTSGMFYTHECKDGEIAYFKVVVNMIETQLIEHNFSWNYLGNA